MEVEAGDSKRMTRWAQVMQRVAEMRKASPFELDAHQCRRKTHSCSSGEVQKPPAPCLCPALARLHPSNHGPYLTRLTFASGSSPDMNHIFLYSLASESFVTLRKTKNASAEAEPPAASAPFPLPSSSRLHAETSPGLSGTTLSTSVVPFSQLG